MTMKLLPCPFCGGTELFMDDNGETNRWIACNNLSCGAEGPFREGEEPAAQAWNHRRPRLGTSFPGNETFDDEPGRA